MTVEIQAVLAIFDELAVKYERLLADLAHLERQWKTSWPEQVRVLRDAMEEIAAMPSASQEIREKALGVIGKDGNR